MRSFSVAGRFGDEVDLTVALNYLGVPYQEQVKSIYNRIDALEKHALSHKHEPAPQQRTLSDDEAMRNIQAYRDAIREKNTTIANLTEDRGRLNFELAVLQDKYDKLAQTPLKEAGQDIKAEQAKNAKLNEAIKKLADILPKALTALQEVETENMAMREMIATFFIGIKDVIEATPTGEEK